MVGYAQLPRYFSEKEILFYPRVLGSAFCFPQSPREPSIGYPSPPAPAWSLGGSASVCVCVGGAAPEKGSSGRSEQRWEDQAGVLPLSSLSAPQLISFAGVPIKLAPEALEMAGG